MLRFLFITLLLFLFWGCEGNLMDSEESSSDIPGSFNKSADQSRGSALSLDGDGDYVVIQDDPSLDMTNGFTIAAWIYLESYTEWASLVTKGTDANNYTIHQSGPAGGSEYGHLRFTGTLATLPLYLESDTQIPLQEWHHVAITFDGSALTFYLDGGADGGGALTGPLVTNDEPMHIGADFPFADEFWHGAIDEVKIWNEALAAKHVKTAMNGHSSPKANALAGLWRFDEAAGTTADDRSKNRNDGVLMGDAGWTTP